jgi:hypothetical protein
MPYVIPNYDACDVDFTGDTAYVVRNWDAADATFNEDDPEVIITASSPLGGELVLLTASFALFVSANSPLGDPALLISSTNLYAAADSPLGTVLVLLSTPQYAIVAADSPLGAPATLINSESGDTLQELRPEFYVVDITTPNGVVRFPVSSWSASLEVDKASYVGVVVPAATSEVIDVLDAMTSFRLVRYAAVSPGTNIEVEVASASTSLSVQTDGGPTNNTATVAGYTSADAYPSNDNPNAVFDLSAFLTTDSVCGQQ